MIPLPIESLSVTNYNARRFSGIRGVDSMETEAAAGGGVGPGMEAAAGGCMGTRMQAAAAGGAEH